jgi:hypothetical protein
LCLVAVTTSVIQHKKIASKGHASNCRIWCDSLQELSKFKAGEDIIMVTGLVKSLTCIEI